MSETPDNPRAFPAPDRERRNPQQSGTPAEWYTLEQSGMTLRDWFAGQALAGRMARPSEYRSWEDAAQGAYEVADAMLAERAKP